MNPNLQIGTQLALALAALYLPSSDKSGKAVTGLTALMAAIAAFNAQNGRPADYVPSREEIDAFIASREARRIPVPAATETPEPSSTPAPGAGPASPPVEPNDSGEH